MSAMHGADGIIFDCDGVLVDVSESYTQAIIQTTTHVMSRLGMPTGYTLRQDTIQSFKDTGGFNNEIDLAYAATLCLAGAHRTGLDPHHTLRKGSVLPDAGAVEEYAAGLGIKDVIDTVSYPSSGNIVSMVFDQLFYGPDMYAERFGKASDMAGPGLIERERVLIDDTLASWLQNMFGSSISMLTGRSLASARRTLGGRMDMFNMAGSVFLEDMPRSMAKPNPEALFEAVRCMGISRGIYVGDSAEDVMMAQAVDGITFVGVYGTAPDPTRRQTLFGSMGVKHAVRSILDLPEAIVA